TSVPLSRRLRRFQEAHTPPRGNLRSRVLCPPIPPRRCSRGAPRARRPAMAASASVDSVTTTRLRGPLRFVTSAALGQVVTYLLVGLIASRALDYADILGRPAISAYYLPYGSVDFVVST